MGRILREFLRPLFTNHSKVVTTGDWGVWFDTHQTDTMEQDTWGIITKSFLWGRENSLHQPCPIGYNLAKEDHFKRNSVRSDQGNSTGTTWVDSFHRDNNLYGVNNGEYYNWVFVSRTGMKVTSGYGYTNDPVYPEEYEYVEFNGETIHYASETTENDWWTKPVAELKDRVLLSVLSKARRFHTRNSRTFLVARD